MNQRLYTKWFVQQSYLIYTSGDCPPVILMGGGKICCGRVEMSLEGWSTGRKIKEQKRVFKNHRYWQLCIENGCHTCVNMHVSMKKHVTYNLYTLNQALTIAEHKKTTTLSTTDMLPRQCMWCVHLFQTTQMCCCCLHVVIHQPSVGIG